jgi:hypothetical protein
MKPLNPGSTTQVILEIIKKEMKMKIKMVIPVEDAKKLIGQALAANLTFSGESFAVEEVEWGKYDSEVIFKLESVISPAPQSEDDIPF